MRERIVDVREFPEYAAAHIEGSELMPLNALNNASEHWDREERILLVCRTGRRAEQARQQLIARGFSSAAALPGGMEEWVASGKPVQRLRRRS